MFKVYFKGISGDVGKSIRDSVVGIKFDFFMNVLLLLEVTLPMPYQALHH